MVPWSRPPAIKKSSDSNSMATPVTARLSPALMSLNGPESEPVVYNPTTIKAATFDEDEDRCRACHATDLYTDWKQGDRVCTSCGVVAEGRLRDDRPEWKDFNDAEDLVKGLPSNARCGLVPVDESKYVGGLQPTLLSKQAFGGESSGGYGLARIRKRLKTTNKKIDYLMEKDHSKALKEAKVDRQIRLKNGDTDASSSERPDLDFLVLQEEEDAHRLQATLYAEKWSLDRAMLLHGEAHEQRENPEEDRDNLLSRLDNTLRKASKDLYAAYSILTHAARELHLPDRVQTEVVHRLVRFVTRRDGIRIPGVASRLSKTASAQERKEATTQLQEFNQRKQIAALAAAILFLTARSLGWTRSIVEICASFSSKDEPALLKSKHCSRAMKEIQSTFPEYARQGNASTPTPTANGAVATSNFAEHAVRRLQLPPVAEASIRTLLVHLRDEQVNLGHNSGTKLSTLCAAVAYFICSTGSVMQRLAQQHQHLNSQTKRALPANTAHSVPRKKRRVEDQKRGFSKTADKTDAPRSDSLLPKDAGNSSGDDDLGPDNSKNVSHREGEEDEEPFDVFSHAPVVEDQSEKQAYELRRMWDAWAEQMPWTRTVVEVEQSCGVSRKIVTDFYKTKLYPRRQVLLEVLGTSIEAGESNFLQETPLAPILLARITTAASIMSVK